MAMSFDDYVNAYYGGTLGISKRYGIQKDTLATADDGYFNTMFGATVFNQLNTRSEMFKLLKKEGWEKSGWRVLTARGTTTAGVSEGGALPTSDVPDMDEVTATLKEVATRWVVTTKAELLSDADDGIKNLASFLRKEQAATHAFYIDQMLLSTADVAQGDDINTIDRVTLGTGGATAMDTYVEADSNIYDIDRSATTSWSAPNENHGSGTNRVLALSYLDDVIQGCLTNGANYNDLIIMTGHDTYSELKQLLQTGTNNLYRADVGAGGGVLNGVAGESGINYDTRVGSYDGIPIYVSQHTAVSTDNNGTSISHIHVLDMKNLAMRIAAPTTYLDASNMAVNGKLSKEHALITAGEMIAYKFQTMGSVRDLKA